MWLSAQIRQDLIYWKNPRDSGIVFGSVLVVLLAVKYVSLISVVANLSLAFVTATMAFRIYKSVLAALNKTDCGHPFMKYLDYDVKLPRDQVQACFDSLLIHFNQVLVKFRGIFLVEDLIESVKFAVAMYLLTYIGGWVNGLSVVIAVWVLAFTAPKLYQDNQLKIDDALKAINIKWSEACSKLKTSTSVAEVSSKKEQ